MPAPPAVGDQPRQSAPGLDTELPPLDPRAPAATPDPPDEVPADPPRQWGEGLLDNLVGLGDWSLFSARAITGVFSTHLKIRELASAAVEVGVSSVAVVAITGVFIGMVLAVQAYSQFHLIGLDTSLGGVIHMSVVRELGPVLAAVMLAGRVGTAMAAQLGTMRVTEQIDALACLGVDPVKYLVAPRFLGCILVIPLLTVIADALGIMGSSFICLKVFHIDGFHYWRHTADFVAVYDVFIGLGKSVLVRRRTEPDLLPPRVPLEGRAGGRRPGGDRRVRAVVRVDPDPRLCPGHGHQRRPGAVGAQRRGAGGVNTESPADEAKTDPVIRLDHVTVRFGRQTVLNDVSARHPPEPNPGADRGERVRQVGHAQTHRRPAPADRGECLLPGPAVWSGLNDRELTAMRLKVGFLFQQAALFDSLTVADNVSFGLRAKGGLTPADIDAKVKERLLEVGLPAATGAKMPADLSGGMKKRVGLARALALDPDVMLYDEPTTGLDPIMTDVINELILQTRSRRPVTSVVVTHEMRTVHKVADRVVMFYPSVRLTPGESQVLYDGPPQKLLTSTDPRVRQFVEGEARDRLTELRGEAGV